MSNIEQTTPIDTNVSSHTSKTTQDVSKGSLIASVIAGITASACCIGPFVLLTLGVSGSWIGNLAALEPLRPVFIGITAIFLGLAFRKLYLVPQSCDINSPCENPSYLRKQRLIFWVVTVVVIAVIAFPWYGPILLDD